MKIEQAQAIIREASEGYLSDHPPIGVKAVLADLARRLTPVESVEFRKPFVRIPDECDDEPDCPACLGQGDFWATEDQEWGDCPYCSGEGSIPFNYNQVFIMIYRNFHSVEALVTVTTKGECLAVVTVAEPGFKAGDAIQLTETEADLCRCAVKQKD